MTNILFCTRIRQESWLSNMDANNVEVYVGRFCGASTPNNEEWNRQISAVEKLLIFAHGGNEYCQTILAKLPLGCDYRVQRFWDMAEFLQGFDLHTLRSGQTRILDLDLDYFNKSHDGLFAQIEPLEQIRATLQKLKFLCDWELITVAISPEYCGGEEEARLLFQTFVKEFELDLSQASHW